MPPSARSFTEDYLQRLMDQARARDGDVAAQLLHAQLEALPEAFAFLGEGGLDREARQTLAGLLPPTARALRAGRPVLDASHPYRHFLQRLAGFASRLPSRESEVTGWRQRIGDLVEQVRSCPDIRTRDAREWLGKLERLERREARLRESARRRAEQAARARDRLQRSREAAAEVVEQLLARLPAAPAAAELLSGPWENVIVILCLRHGRDALETTRAVSTAQQLLRWSAGTRPLPERLARRLADGLGLVGFDQGEAQRHLAELAAAVASWRQEAPALPPKAPEADQAPEPAALPDAEELSAAALEAAVDVPPPPAPARERPRSFAVGGTTMSVGDWVELRRRDGSTRAAKLSWVSPITGNLLFVDERGMRVADLSLDAFRAGVAARQARLLGARP